MHSLCILSPKDRLGCVVVLVSSSSRKFLFRPFKKRKIQMRHQRQQQQRKIKNETNRLLSRSVIDGVILSKKEAHSSSSSSSTLFSSVTISCHCLIFFSALTGKLNRKEGRKEMAGDEKEGNWRTFAFRTSWRWFPRISLCIWVQQINETVLVKFVSPTPSTNSLRNNKVTRFLND